MSAGGPPPSASTASRSPGGTLSLSLSLYVSSYPCIYLSLVYIYTSLIIVHLFSISMGTGWVGSRQAAKGGSGPDVRAARCAALRFSRCAAYVASRRVARKDVTLRHMMLRHIAPQHITESCYITLYHTTSHYITPMCLYELHTMMRLTRKSVL